MNDINFSCDVNLRELVNYHFFAIKISSISTYLHQELLCLDWEFDGQQWHFFMRAIACESNECKYYSRIIIFKMTCSLFFIEIPSLQSLMYPSDQNQKFLLPSLARSQTRCPTSDFNRLASLESTESSRDCERYWRNQH